MLDTSVAHCQASEEGTSCPSSTYDENPQWYRHSISRPLQRNIWYKAAGRGKAAHLALLQCELKLLSWQLHQLLRAPGEEVMACRDIPAGRIEIVRLLR